MAEAHDGGFAGDAGGDFELVGDGVFGDDQGVVAGAGHGLRQAAEDAAIVMGDGRGFAVHELGGADAFAAKGRALHLLPRMTGDEKQLHRGSTGAVGRLRKGAWHGGFGQSSSLGSLIARGRARCHERRDKRVAGNELRQGRRRRRQRHGDDLQAPRGQFDRDLRTSEWPAAAQSQIDPHAKRSGMVGCRAHHRHILR